MYLRGLIGLRRAGSVVALLAVPGMTEGQVPGIPALQNAFVNPGLAVAGNLGGGGGQSFYGAAVGYGMMGGRLLVSGAAGVQRLNDATRGAYGARAAMALWGSEGGALGAGVFAGIGGAASTTNDLDVETNPAVMSIPLGATVGYRRGFGETRGISAYASPIYRWSRLDDGGASTNSGSCTVALGLDVGLTRSFGASVGAELGDAGGTSSTVWGLALSFVPGR
jgi:hypothetical protein